MGEAAAYRHQGSGLLRATADSVAPGWWPEPTDAHACGRWLREIWQCAEFASAVRQASPVLAERVDNILAAGEVPAKDVMRAGMAVMRYALRASRRPTPFGTFAGVAPVSIRTSTWSRWGDKHRPIAHADVRWLHRVIDTLEQRPELLALLEVTFNDLAEPRGGRFELTGSSTVSIRDTAAVRMVRDEAAASVPFSVLADKLADTFPQAGNASGMLSSLVSNGFLRTSLRAPSTVVDPLRYLLDRLREVGADSLAVHSTFRELASIDESIRAHNNKPDEAARLAITSRMRALADPVSVPLAVDLRLDAQAHLPHHVAREMERAAGVLARLARETTGTREWREYFAAFCEQYGTDTLVPLRMMTDPDSGIGFPRGYPGSMPSSDRHVYTLRDELLHTMVTRAIAQGCREIELDDATVAQLSDTGDGDSGTFPPHVDMGARVHADSAAEIDRGEFTLTVAPGRAAGTLSSRFTPLVPDVGLEHVFGNLPTTTREALPAQLSFAPIHASAENVCRVPQSLPDIVSIGERGASGAVRVDDLAVTASGHRLHLVSLSERRVVEPEVLHALAPKQQPPLARLVGSLARALDTGWIGFDWGAAGRLPFRPRLRYNRAVLSPATWRVTRDDLQDNVSTWDAALESWRACWGCPTHVELREFGPYPIV